jgi:hypothetical protein
MGRQGSGDVKRVTGVAWLSSARVVRCLVHSFNERNPFGELFQRNTLSTLPVIYWRKERITSSHHDPYGLGYTRVTMAVTKGSNGESRSKSKKAVCQEVDCQRNRRKGKGVNKVHEDMYGGNSDGRQPLAKLPGADQGKTKEGGR